jgi:hypothetical protein
MAPAATLSAPAEDMAAFMIAHLQGGAYRGTRILQEATARQMRATQFTYHPALAGQAFGFIEGLSEGQPRSIYHTGGDPGRLCSLMSLLPEENVGLYVVQNADDGCAMIDNVRNKLVERTYPRDAEASGLATDLTPPADFERRAGQYAGVYRFGNYFHKTASKLQILELQGYPRVTAPGDGTLEIDYTGDPDQEPWKYVEVGPNLFTLVNYPEIGVRHVAFVTDDAGRVIGFSWDSQYLFERVPWHGRPGLHKALFLLFAAAFVLGAVGGGVALWRARQHRPALGLVALNGLLNTLALGGIIVLMNLSDELGTQIFSYHRNPLPAVILAVVFLVTSVLAVVILGLSAWLWRKRAWPAWARALYAAFSLIAVAFIPLLSYWNLLGFHW